MIHRVNIVHLRWIKRQMLKNLWLQFEVFSLPIQMVAKERIASVFNSYFS